MIPLILLALGLGAALTVYEFSPRTRSRVDAYARAIRSANAAHQTADAHLGNANAVAVTAARHAQQANAARQARQPPAPPPVQWAPAPVPWVPMPMPEQPTPAPPAPMPTAPMPEPAPAPLPPPPYVPAPPPPVPAQDVADAQANAAQAAADAAVDHATAAIEENQTAAKNTAEAAMSAQAEAQRQEVAQSAAKVLEREKKIAAALASFGIGQCGVRSYPRVTERAKNALLTKLHAEGMSVTGDNPWNIATHEYDVKLRAMWDPKAQVLKLIVTAGKGGYFGLVTCDEIWKKIEPILKGVIG